MGIPSLRRDVTCDLFVNVIQERVKFHVLLTSYEMVLNESGQLSKVRPGHAKDHASKCLSRTLIFE